MSDPACKSLLETARQQSQDRQYDAALATYRAAYQRRPVPWLLVNIGRIQQKLGRLDEAIATYNECLSDLSRIDQATAAKAAEYLKQAAADLARQKPPAEDPPVKPPASGAEQSPTSGVEQPPTSGVEQPPASAPARPGPAVPGVPALALRRDPAPARSVPAHKAASRPIWKRWWFWGAVGLAAAAGVTGAVVGTYPRGADVPADLPRIPLDFKPAGARP